MTRKSRPITIIGKILGTAAVAGAIALSCPSVMAMPDVSADMPATELKKVANKGDVNAMLLYANSQYEAENYKEAIKYYKKAADKGAALGQYMCGYMRLHGQGKSASTIEALGWFTEAADNGSADAMMELSRLYGNGFQYEAFGTVVSNAPDRAESEKWLRKAAKHGNAEAMARVLPRLSGKERMDMLEKLGAAGDKDALLELGAHYANPADGNYNYEKARDYLTRSGDQYALATLEKTEQIRREDQAAKERQAQETADLKAKADSGDMDAILKLAHAMRKDNNHAQAADLYRKAADAGNGEAMYWLAECYYFGNGVPKDRAEAFRLYRKAEGAGMADNADLLYSLGYMYAHGDNVAKDVTTGRKYLNAAKAKGNSYAAEELNKLDSERAAQKKADLQTRKATNIRVLGKSYVADYEMDGFKVRQGIRFDPNGRLAITTGMLGSQETHRGQWSQDGTKITTNAGTLWLDSSGNLHQFYSNGAEIIYRRK